MTYEEALDTMCKRCTNHEMCQGTGCNPKNVLAEAIEKQVPKAARVEEYETKSQRGRTIRCKKYICSNCGKSNGRKITPYCPYCGQRLER